MMRTPWRDGLNFLIGSTLRASGEFGDLFEPLEAIRVRVTVGYKGYQGEGIDFAKRTDLSNALNRKCDADSA